jgi:hypothetical protein
MGNTLLLPTVGTLIPFVAEDIARSADERTHMCRVTYSESAERWVIASRLNITTGRWIPLTTSRRIGLMVFLNSAPEKDQCNIRISAVKPTGRAVWGDPI